ncbi:hypothetical protein O6H91_10G106900 [Diphasiastrum complanatum]|uniref:Uncharacterized protein n=1 Tax=Diphasiastrum complanatum TaxID=34168 RepID=A0ACC2CKC8_DIPCM|nr:hypothetical protein O6H91_10G106900 [Diphasiastrum complanatum]
MSVTKFCPECNNLLYPREDRRQQILIYACGSCNHKEKADSNIVYWKQIQQPGEDESLLPQDLTSETTLPRTKNVRCALCNYREAVFFQAKARGEEGMSLVFICCNSNCGHRWQERPVAHHAEH